jgi:hypothetical protein
MIHHGMGRHGGSFDNEGDFYRLTADGTIMTVKFLLDHAPAGGYHTEHADRRALRGRVARVHSHPRGLAVG